MVNTTHFKKTTYLTLEPLESRTLFSATLLVTGLAVPLDATHFHTIQAALLAAQSGDTIQLQSGFATDSSTPSTLVLNKSITLSADAGVTLPITLELATSGITLSHISGSNLVFDAGSFGNAVNDSTLGSVLLKGGSHNNTFTHNTIAGLTVAGGDDTSGHDLFVNNTFTAMVAVNGNPTTAIAEVFTNNTFTITNGDALTLTGASGTTVQGSIITDSSPFASGIVVHNADNVVLLNNTITTTGMNGTGLYIYSDGTGSTSVDIRGNSSKTGSGFGIYIAKYDDTAAMELRVQGNDLRGNAIGAFIFGDGSTSGKVDFGGGTTRFGTSSGQNDFSSYTSADGSHYAIGLFATDPGDVLVANNNYFGVANPLSVVADGSHDLAAFGTGVVMGTPYVAPTITETITATTTALAGIETGVVSGIVAHFSSNISHVAADFAVTIAWGDGTTSPGIVVANASGGFDVMASHSWSDAGSYTFTTSVSDSNASKNVQGSATIDSRVIAVTGVDFTSTTKQAFNGVVANFTDNLLGTNASMYTASVAWSDGMTTKATLVKNADGTFSIKTSRSFTKAGVVLASISIGTVDGLFFGTTSLTATITATTTTNNGNCGGHDGKGFRQLVCYLRHNIKSHSYSHGRPALAGFHCHK